MIINIKPFSYKKGFFFTVILCLTTFIFNPISFATEDEDRPSACRSVVTDALPSDTSTETLTRSLDQILAELGEQTLPELMGLAKDIGAESNDRCMSMWLLATHMKRNNMPDPFWEGEDRYKCTRKFRKASKSSHSSSSSSSSRPKETFTWTTTSSGKRVKTYPSDLFKLIANRIEEDNPTIHQCAMDVLSSFHPEGYSNGIGWMMWKYIYPKYKKTSATGEEILVPGRSLYNNNITERVSERMRAIGGKDVAKKLSCSLCHHHNKEEIAGVMLTDLREILSTMTDSADREDRETIVANVTECILNRKFTIDGNEVHLLSRMLSQNRLEELFRYGNEPTPMEMQELVAKLGHRFNSPEELTLMMRLIHHFPEPPTRLTATEKEVLIRVIGDRWAETLNKRGDLTHHEIYQIRIAIMSKIEKERKKTSPITPQALLQLVRIATDFGGERAVGPLIEYYKTAVKNHPDQDYLRDPQSGASRWISTKDIARDFILRNLSGDSEALMPFLKVVVRDDRDRIYPDSEVLKAFDSLSVEQRQEIIRELTQSFEQQKERDLLEIQSRREVSANSSYRFSFPGRVDNFLTLTKTLGANTPDDACRAVIGIAIGRELTGTVGEDQIRMYRDYQAQKQGLAIMALSKIRPTERVSLDGLFSVLGDPNLIIGNKKDIALAIIDYDLSNARRVLDILLDQLGGPNSDAISRIILEIINKFKPAIIPTFNSLLPQLSAKLEDSEVPVRSKMNILVAMKEFSNNSAINSRLIQLVTSSPLESELKADIVRHLGRSPPTEENFTMMMGWVNNSDPEVQAAALEQIRVNYAGGSYKGIPDSRIGPIITTMNPLLESDNPSLRKGALAVLGRLAHSLADIEDDRFGRRSPEEKSAAKSKKETIWEQMERMLADPDDSVRSQVADSLEFHIDNIREESPGLYQRILPKLIARTAAEGNSEYTRSYALETLGRSQDSRAFETISACLNDSNPRVRRAAAEALGSLRDARAEEHLVRTIRTFGGDEDKNLRHIAYESLGEIGASSPQAIAILVSGVQAGSEEAATALGRIGENTPEANTPAVVQCLRNAASGTITCTHNKWYSTPRYRQAYFQNQAIRALGRVGATDSESLRIVSQTLSNRRTDSKTKEAAITALGNMGEDAIPILAQEYQGSGSNRESRQWVVESLAHLMDDPSLTDKIEKVATEGGFAEDLQRKRRSLVSDREDVRAQERERERLREEMLAREASMDATTVTATGSLDSGTVTH